MVNYRTKSRVVFNIFNYFFLLFLSITIILPFVNAFALSLSDPDAISKGVVGLAPVGFNFKSYIMIFRDRLFLFSVRNTILLTVVNTCLVILVALSAASALASKHFRGVKIAYFYSLIPMYFGGGLIPSYLWMNDLHLRNSMLVMILPVITNVFLIVIFRNTIMQLPAEMRESAEIDGGGELIIMFRIVMPLIMPTVIAFVIFNAVGYWNEWFNCMIYIQDPYKFTLQYKLREILTTNDLQNMIAAKGGASGIAKSLKDMVHPQNLRMAALLVTILPIMIIYPFLQKYFIHGVIVGAVKG
ncbi:MAG: carbohydrate ABC transporter permease [Clostridiaceae bacterium]